MTVHRPPVPCPCGQVPNLCIPSPVTLTCIRCTKPFITDATSPAASGYDGFIWPHHDGSIWLHLAAA